MVLSFTYERKGVVAHSHLNAGISERKDMQKELKRVKDNGTADEVEYWDKRQLVKKINLNSLYGAIPTSL